MLLRRQNLFVNLFTGMYTSDFGKICFQLLLHEIEFLTSECFMVYTHHYIRRSLVIQSQINCMCQEKKYHAKIACSVNTPFQGRFSLTRPDRSERSNCCMEHKTFGLPTYLTGKF